MSRRAEYMTDHLGERFRIEDFTDLACPKCGQNRLRFNGKWYCVGWADEHEQKPCGWSQYRETSHHRAKAFKEAEATWALEHEQMSY